MSFHFQQGTKIAYSFEISHGHEQIIRIPQNAFSFNEGIIIFFLK
jgi:hypothetical protein